MRERTGLGTTFYKVEGEVVLGFVVVVTIEISEPPCLSKFHAFGKMSVEKIVIYFLGKIPLLVKYFIFSSAKIISNRILNESIFAKDSRI